jgi:hypothetical protein
VSSDATSNGVGPAQGLPAASTKVDFIRGEDRRRPEVSQADRIAKIESTQLFLKNRNIRDEIPPTEIKLAKFELNNSLNDGRKGCWFFADEGVERNFSADMTAILSAKGKKIWALSQDDASKVWKEIAESRFFAAVGVLPDKVLTPANSINFRPVTSGGIYESEVAGAATWPTKALLLAGLLQRPSRMVLREGVWTVAVEPRPDEWERAVKVLSSAGFAVVGYPSPPADEWAIAVRSMADFEQLQCRAGTAVYDGRLMDDDAVVARIRLPDRVQPETGWQMLHGVAVHISRTEPDTTPWSEVPRAAQVARQGNSAAQPRQAATSYAAAAKRSVGDGAAQAPVVSVRPVAQPQKRQWTSGPAPSATVPAATAPTAAPAKVPDAAVREEAAKGRTRMTADDQARFDKVAELKRPAPRAPRYYVLIDPTDASRSGIYDVSWATLQRATAGEGVAVRAIMPQHAIQVRAVTGLPIRTAAPPPRKPMSAGGGPGGSAGAGGVDGGMVLSTQPDAAGPVQGQAGVTNA